MRTHDVNAVVLYKSDDETMQVVSIRGDLTWYVAGELISREDFKAICAVRANDTYLAHLDSLQEIAIDVGRIADRMHREDEPR